ncbi:hypothetical protein N199_03320 [Helicobacter pylori UM038]|uniref:Uncharacterized protein n=1 Tax=Helicobacter pylori UM038 TaxID=1352343 RepID=A0AAV3JMN4_HELPX|nr:hypothetical protein N199_03320 [Helicobacter pylori UM038]
MDISYSKKTRGILTSFSLNIALTAMRSCALKRTEFFVLLG